MGMLLFDDHLRDELQDLREYAEANVFTLADMEARLAGILSAPGDDPNFLVTFPVGGRLVYTIESGRNGTLFRRMSMSVNGKLPHPTAILQVMPLLGFTGTLTDCLVDMDEAPHAVNIFQPYTP